jgi:hypothetical protein
MFNKKNKPKIEFICTVEGLEQVKDCLPRPAKHFIPQWFKDIPNSDPMTVKICPSFPDYFSQGYIIPMWADVRLKYEKENDNWEWEGNDNLFKWENHGNNQFLKYTKANLRGADAQFVFKANSPWRIITPPGWSVLQLPLFYHFNQEWSVMPGVIDTDVHSDINQQVLYHGNGKNITINRGDPFVLYIPFKRSSKLDYEIRYQTDKDKNKFWGQHVSMATVFRPNGTYRKIQRERDKN